MTADVVDGSSPAAPAIFQTAAFTFDDQDLLTEAWSRPDGAFAYSRLQNPTVRTLEATVAKMESGQSAFATSSGMGAISMVLLTQLSTGDHIIAQDRLYGGTFALLRELTQRWGIEVTYVDAADPAAVSNACRSNSRLLYLETIANPLGQVYELPALMTAGHRAGLITVVDNTLATPCLCQPITYGADIVVHSMTKYLGGHSDVVGGIAVFADADSHRQFWSRAIDFGATLDPFAAWLVLRGIQTLPLRVHRQCENARYLADRLQHHAAVRSLHYAGLPQHRSHAVATRMLRDYGGVLAFDLFGGRAASRQFLDKLRLVKIAPSLGGTATTVMIPSAISHSQLSESELRAADISPGTVRIAAGLEHAQDLWRDIQRALDACRDEASHRR